MKTKSWLLIAFIFCSLLEPWLANAAEPDFRFPQNVTKNALADVDKAKRNGDKKLLINALLRHAKAQKEVNHGTHISSIALIRDLATAEQQPLYKALLLTLEATIINDATFPASVHVDRPVSADVTQWAYHDKQRAISQLCDSALNLTSQIANEPIGNFKSIIYYNSSANCYPSILDFIFYKINSLKPNLGADFYDRWIALHSERNHDAAIVNIQLEHLNRQVVQGTISFSEKQAKLKELFESHRNNENCFRILDALSFDNFSDRYAALQDYVLRFPRSKYLQEAKNEITNLERINITLSHAILPENRIQFTISNDNAQQFSIEIFKALGENFSEEDYAKLKPLRVINVKVNKSLVFSHDTTIITEPLPLGNYYAHIKTKKKGQYTGDQIIKISNLFSFHYSVAPNQQAHLLAVDSHTGSPKANVKVLSADNGSTLAITNNSGEAIFARPQKGSLRVRLVLGSDTSSIINVYPSYYEPIRSHKEAKIFTDLGVYRPGETLRFSAVIYSSSRPDSLMVLPNEKITMELLDRNYKSVQQFQLITDEYGRVSGEFHIPTNRLNGNWTLKCIMGNRSSHKTISVSEYKTPSFYISFEKATSSFPKNQPIILRGKAMTYSGMPVANAKVVCNLSEQRFLFYHKANYNGSITRTDTVFTDASGNFVLEYDTALFAKRETPLRFMVTSDCTSEAGETQSAKAFFNIGKFTKICFTQSELTAINDSPLSLPIVIESSTDSLTHNCKFNLLTSGDRPHSVMAGPFSPSKPVIDFTSCPSGDYRLQVISDALPDTTEMRLVLYNETDSLIPTRDVLWVPDCGAMVAENNTARITLGTASDSCHVHFVATTSNGSLVKADWLHLAKGKHSLSLPMSNDGSDLHVNFYCISNRTAHQHNVAIAGANSQRKLKINVVSFRDKLLSGSKETLSFSLTDENNAPVQGAVIMEASDKAVQNIRSNTWNFFPTIHLPSFWQFSGCVLPWAYLGNYTFMPQLKQSNFTNQIDFLYHNSINVFYSREEVVMDNTISSQMLTKRMMANGDARISGYLQPDAEESETNLEDVPMRTHDVKTALWQPLITTHADGSFSITFDAPLFNTTWILQAVAYSKNLITGNLHREIETSMPLMVKANLPRFVRAADAVTLTATVSNKLETETEFSGIIEVFNPRTNKIFAKQHISGKLSAMGSSVVSIACNVPTDAMFLGFRIKAMASGSGDGEQVMIPVLSEASPVIEATNFFINAGESSAKVTLPKARKSQVTTLEYCDNPTWYCVTALPSVATEGKAITSAQLAHNIFAASVAAGLARDIPAIPAAICHWKAQNDSCLALASNLTKNPGLKIGSLIASPWIGESEREALRMSRLDQLFDSAAITRQKAELIAQLRKFQNSDGGFKWIAHPAFNSNWQSTMTVVELLGEVKLLGYLPNDSSLQTEINQAVAYLDSTFIKEYRAEVKRNTKSFAHHLGYAYVRTLFSNIPLAKNNQAAINRVITDIAKDWGELNLASKAYSALTLARNGKQKVAKEITESIRQFATTDTQGMHWNCISSNWWRYRNELAITTTLLQALHEIDGDASEVNQIRKWVLLQKQSNDWGNSSLAADAIFALLTTGTDWLQHGAMPIITIGGKQLQTSATDSILGYSRLQIELPQKATPLSIVRNQSNSLAWGTIYTQYTDKVTSIKASKTDELEITKTICVNGRNGTLTPASNLKVGDKVTVLFTIKASKDVSFVTLNDQRGACFEPTDKLSGYTKNHGEWYYKEIKDSETNLFFNFLSRGTHIVSYEAHVTNAGKFSIGIATIQSQYAASHVAHTAGTSVNVVQ